MLAPEITRGMIKDYVRRPRRDADPHRGLANLTRRELEVIGLIAQGRSNARISIAMRHTHEAQLTVGIFIGPTVELDNQA
jgi:DNA-binding NarL/FixJ family response regulator